MLYRRNKVIICLLFIKTNARNILLNVTYKNIEYINNLITELKIYIILVYLTSFKPHLHKTLQGNNIRK